MSRLPKSLRKKFGNNHRFGCRSGKRRYFDYGTAYLELLAISERMERHGEEKVVKDIYRCAMCGGYHLTSKEGNVAEQATA